MIQSFDFPAILMDNHGPIWANDWKDRPSHQGGQILSQAGGKTHMQLGPKSEVALIGWQIMLFTLAITFTSVSRGNPWQMMQCKDVRELADLCDRFLLHPETLFGDLFQNLETCCY
jgi:hypothetical protein